MSQPSRTRLRLRGPVTCLLATAGLLAGLVVDVVVHWLVTGHEEAGLFDLRNPGHLLVGVSLGVLAGAVCLTLLDARRSRRALAGALTGALLVGAGGLGLGVADSRVREATAHASGDPHPEEVAHEPDGGHGAADPHPEALPHEADGGHAAADEPDPAQLEQIQAATEKYQDIEVALAEGYYQASEDYPRQGAHFSNDEWSYLDEFDPARPSTLLYTQRLTGEWQLVGLGYGLSLDAYPAQPTDVAGAHWHRHRWTCTFSGDPFPTIDEPVTEEECLAQGGEWFEEFGWDLHVWAWLENPLGPFEDNNPLLP